MTTNTRRAWLPCVLAVAVGSLLSGGCGDKGPAGDPGAPGTSCWDLNANGACDPDSEDYTDDGVCDVRDCRGEAGTGMPGIACWDLDENDACDVDPEDVNGDGVCSVADCAGVIFGMLSGTVSSEAGDALADVAITLFPAVAGVDLMSDATGAFNADLPVGSYAVTFELDGYETQTLTAPIAADETTTLDVALVPTDGVLVDAGDDFTGAPGDTGMATADVTIRDGSTGTTYAWTLVSGPDLAATGTDTDTISVTFPDELTYRDTLIEALSFPENRLQVIAINPLAIEETEVSTYQLEVTTSSGTYTDTVSFHADLPYDIATGIRDVPIGRGVVLFAPEDTSYSWSMTGPSGSTASLIDTDQQVAVFVPDAAGDYTVTANGTDIVIHADNWVGAVGGIGADGNVTGSTACTGCHNGSIAPDNFTGWRASGHAEIFQNNLNTSGHYGDSCFMCHTVGYDPDADNGGFDDSSDYMSFVDDILHGGAAPDNYSRMSTEMPDAFKLTNIQCENCHGPAYAGHTASGADHDARISLGAGLCGSCHGEPLRHARFQQWELSGHANYQLAIDRAGSSSCSACHTVQGFLSWLQEGIASGTMPSSTTTAPEAEEALPQTCVACHSPHQQGDTSGEPNNATVRLAGSTPILNAGFAAIGVGRGAICMVCHNSRRAANDRIGSVPSGGSAPHRGPQADTLMGQNYFFVEVGQRAGHSYLPDTCTTCHMEETDPPAALSYALGGTNHTFAASVAICGNCHGDFDGEGLTTAFELETERLGEHLADFAATYINGFGSIDVVAVDPLDGASSSETTITLGGGVTVTAAEVTEGHGRMELDLTLSAPVDFDFSGTTRSLSEFAVQLAALQVGGTSNAIFPEDSNYAKAQWNFHMLEADGSHGVHNPGFVNQVLVNSMTFDLSVGAATP